MFSRGRTNKPLSQLAEFTATYRTFELSGRPTIRILIAHNIAPPALSYNAAAMGGEAAAGGRAGWSQELTSAYGSIAAANIKA